MSREEYKDAIEVSIVFHEGQRMFAVPKQPAPVQSLPFGVGGGLVAIKTLLSRDPCVHANTAIEMIDAILSAHAQPAPVQEPVAQAWDEGYRAGIDDERTSEASIGIAGFDAKVEPARNNPYRTTPPAQPAPVPLTARELELIDGMIEVQLDHAKRCDSIANRTMAERQKGWDMERVALLQKIRATPPAAPVPLTDDQIEDLLSEANRGFCIEREDYFKAFRDAEAAHGITAAPEKGQP
jgi:hypothetical protein